MASSHIAAFWRVEEWCAISREIALPGKTIHENTRSGTAFCSANSCDFVVRSIPAEGKGETRLGHSWRTGELAFIVQKHIMKSHQTNQLASNTSEPIVASAVTARPRTSSSSLARTIGRILFVWTALSATKRDSIKSPAGAEPIARKDINRRGSLNRVLKKAKSPQRHRGSEKTNDRLNQKCR